jgi:hypothetical protein
LSSDIRKFDTGATRDTDIGKNDYEGFLCPLVIEAYGNYMTKHRVQADGDIRDSDNWQKGIPKNEYVKSAWRHLLDLWKYHRGYETRDGIDEALGGLLFNIMGYWHELLKERRAIPYRPLWSSGYIPPDVQEEILKEMNERDDIE